jgi:hypothetical protein
MNSLPADPLDDVEDLWGIGCEEVPVDLPDGRRRHGITIRRVLTDTEVEVAQAANSLLAEQVNSPYARLMHQFGQLFDGVDATLRLTNAAERLEGDSLQQRFNNVLHAFKTFLDHTRSGLRRRYGKGSAVEDEFIAACAAEYDTTFEYRLCYNLRNEAEHKRDVVDVSFGGRLNQDGSVQRHVSMTLAKAIVEDPLLKRWQAPVRRELRAHPQPIQADQLMQDLQLCIGRIFAKTLLAQRTGLEGAIASIRELSRQAECDGRPALIHYGPPDAGIPKATRMVQITPLQTEAGDVIERALADSEHLVQ